ncbi:hypothetical protein BT69DRAFT_1307087 [Atractiella rhizophila]|nr:hypothetical protein BT69DRAFT_1307087 [Atractiella rhizophila]
MEGELDAASTIKFDMIRAHVILKNGYTSILKQVDEDHYKDLPNWIGYVEAWCVTVAHHHDAEELHLFPYLSTKMNVHEELEDHKIIHDGIEDLLKWIVAAKSDRSKYSAQLLKEKLSRMGPTFLKHLDEEVEHLSHENLLQFPEDELGSAWKGFLNYAKTHSNPFIALPFIKSHTPPEYKWWPAGVPWIINKLMVPLLPLKHSGYWKYAPYPTS